MLVTTTFRPSKKLSMPKPSMRRLKSRSIKLGSKKNAAVYDF